MVSIFNKQGGSTSYLSWLLTRLHQFLYNTGNYYRYQSFLPVKLARLDPRTFCEALFRAVGVKSSEFKFGNNKVFFKAGKVKINNNNNNNNNNSIVNKNNNYFIGILLNRHSLQNLIN